MHRIAFAVHRGFEILDVAGPSSALNSANRALRWKAKQPFNEIDLVSGAGGRVTSRSGIAVDTQRIGELSSRAVDTLLIAGAERGPLIEAMTDPEMRKALPQVTGKVERFGSVCTGAFFLAASACSTAIASPPIGMPANRWPERSRH